MIEVNLVKETGSWRAAAMAGAVVLIGIGILCLTSVESLWRDHQTAEHAIEKIGDLIFATGLLAVLWELKGKRDFFREILATMRISAELRAAGISEITSNFRDGIEWQKLFRNARELDILFAYARTWRNTNLDSLRELAAKPHARIRIIMPNPDHATTMASLAVRYALTAEEVTRRINESVHEFAQLAQAGGATIEIWLMDASPVYTMYRFDTKAVVSLYNHQVDRSPVPAMIVEEEGILYRFVQEDFNKLLNDGRCRRVFP